MATGKIESLSFNKSSGAVDLSSYTDQTHYYDFPCDGYLVMKSGSVSSGRIEACVFTANWVQIYTYINIVGIYQTQSRFVKKGFHVFFSRVPSGATVEFVPLDQ